MESGGGSVDAEGKEGNVKNERGRLGVKRKIQSASELDWV